jgi:hypothetical protein
MSRWAGIYALSLCGFLGLASDRAGAVGITLDPASQLRVISADGDELLHITSLPASGSLQVGSVSTVDTAYDLSESGFTITFDHANGGTATTAGLFFTPEEDVPYVIAGEYTAHGPGGELVEFTADLLSFTAGDLFFFYEISDAPDVSFALGSEPGATGTLLAGHEYRFEFGAFENTHSSSGFVQLTFIPEPGTALLLGLGGVAGVMLRRQQLRCGDGTA